MLNESGIPEENKGQMIEEKYINKIEKIEEVNSELDESEEEENEIMEDEADKEIENKSLH